ncbi:unnamed protein product [Phytophthora fragariaefolia]|uniref:Unnamed protein product n=1 Tax=Phytophthora fragariaefolia TaxID=1490495 RepID=A0A9W6U192_9STRA|nr:unnamed protein product [Phytophthora fragariaefolia]
MAPKLERWPRTINWPWEKQGDATYNPRLCTVCPCALLMVIGNAVWAGRFYGSQLVGKAGVVPVAYEHDSWNQYALPAPLPGPDLGVDNVWLELHHPKSRTTLQSPRSGFKFRMSMIGAPFLSVTLCGRIPLMFAEFRISGSKKFQSSSS